jgi:AcrR family transcriptional regulator
VSVVSGRSRRAELLAAARRVVEREGFANATVGAITREAGASLGLLNYHFESRDEVVADVFRQLARDDLAELRSIDGRAADGPGRLAAWIASNDPGDRESWRLWVDAWGESLHADAMRRTLQEFRHGWVGTLRRALALGHEQGAWSCPDPAATAAAITAAVDGVGLHVALHPEEVPPDRGRRWIQQLVELHLGVSLPDAPPAPAPEPEPDVAVEVAMRSADLDADGHLRPSVQLVLLEEARRQALGSSPRVLHVELELRRAITLADGPLVASSTIEGPDRTTDRLTVAGGEAATIAHTTVAT